MTSSLDSFADGQRFIYRQARVLERRLFACLYQAASSDGVIDALRAYRNEDGGFGHGLEPDKRCPASLPIDVETALQAMVMAGQGDREMLRQACDFLAAVAQAAGAGGGVPPALPVIEGYPRAEHWSQWTYAPGLNPTAGLVGLLRALGFDHPWVSAGAAYRWHQLETEEMPASGHTISEVLIFLDHNPERERADLVAHSVVELLPSATQFCWDADSTEYGLTSLHLAPRPEGRWRPLFGEAQIESHLEKLAQQQQPDGGWPLSWDPPSEASLLEWRGMETLRALNTLRAYRRL